MAELRVNVDNPTTNPVNVTGSVTTSPSGTQNVAITGQPISTSPTGTQNVALTNQPITMYEVQNPALDGAYVYSQAEVAGVVAANNFMTLTNPVGSGKIIVVAGAYISSYIVGDTAATITSMRGYRASTVSGGTLQAASTIARFQSSAPAPVGEIRTGSVTATLGAGIFNSPPFIGSAKGSIPFVHQVPIPPAGGVVFSLAEGESVVMRTEAGDVDTRWNLSVAWGEI